MSEDKKPFTVSDRRHFTAEGESRSEEPAPPADAPKPAESRGPAEPLSQTVSEPSSGPVAGPSDHAPAAEGEGPAVPTDLIGLLVLLGTQASMLLSGGPSAEDEPADLEAARGFITLLEVLKAKTQGNRTSDEDTVLEGLLYELRMAYLARSRTSA